jgi:hypothetical protein
MTRFFPNFLISIVILSVISCAPTLRDPFGLALHQGQVLTSTLPESLTVDLGVSLDRKGMPPFSARLYARPNHQYRLDAFGFSSQTEASYFWSEGHWTLLMNERREVWEGLGDTLDLEEMGLRLPSVNIIFGFLWGEPLPGFRSRDSGDQVWSDDTLHWKFHGTPWEARFDTIRGICLEARSPSLTLQYRRYRHYGNRILPEEVEVFTVGEPALSLRINRVEDLPGWKKDPFSFRIPTGYKRGTSEFSPDDGGPPRN